MSDDQAPPDGQEIGDEEVFAELKRVIGDSDPVPAEVVAAAIASRTWRRIDAELAELVYDSLVDADPVRSSRGGRRVTFEGPRADSGARGRAGLHRRPAGPPATGTGRGAPPRWQPHRGRRRPRPLPGRGGAPRPGEPQVPAGRRRGPDGHVLDHHLTVETTSSTVRGLAAAEEALRLAQSEPHRSRVLALEALRGTPDPLTSAIAQRALGLSAKARQDLVQARAHLERSVSVALAALLAPAVAAESRASLSPVLWYLGDTAGALHQIDLAAPHLSGAVAARLEMNRAFIMQREGRLDEAMEVYRRILPVMRRLGDVADEASVLTNRGIMHAYRWEFAAAEADLLLAERLHARLGQKLQAADVRHNLGYVAARRGDIATALSRYDAAERERAALGVSTPRRWSTGAKRCSPSAWSPRPGGWARWRPPDWRPPALIRSWPRSTSSWPSGAPAGDSRPRPAGGGAGPAAFERHTDWAGWRWPTSPCCRRMLAQGLDRSAAAASPATGGSWPRRGGSPRPWTRASSPPRPPSDRERSRTRPAISSSPPPPAAGAPPSCGAAPGTRRHSCARPGTTAAAPTPPSWPG